METDRTKNNKRKSENITKNQRAKTNEELIEVYSRRILLTLEAERPKSKTKKDLKKFIKAAVDWKIIYKKEN